MIIYTIGDIKIIIKKEEAMANKRKHSKPCFINVKTVYLLPQHVEAISIYNISD